MTKLGDLYTNFSRIDLDLRGGYARVAQVKTLGQEGIPSYCAFKLMRHDLGSPQKGIDRFEGELKTLVEITGEEYYPPVITQIFDSGFVPSELSESLKKPLQQVENTETIEYINPELDIISTGTDIQSFLSARADLANKSTVGWLPYLIVELAPYHDNLLRQIRTLSSGNTSDLYLMPPREIMSMAIQLLDVIDYLHKKHNFAYMDWKPEHIYWNSLTPQLKVIDWNVTNRFKSDREKKQLIREDVRLFCGAVLYCSLALNDPEDFRRPIGPKPIITPNSVLFSWEPRYWTDKPNFYDRDFMLDDKIKLLIQDGLDPQKGFDSPQELKSELLKYAEQELRLYALDLSSQATSRKKHIEIQELLANADDAYSRSEHQRSFQLYRRVLRIDPINEKAGKNLEKVESELSRIKQTETSLSREAVQLYRSARSYISASDYQEAIRMLEDAIEIAFKKGVIFIEAQELLNSVKISLEVEKIRQNTNQLLNEEKWENALVTFGAAINLDPTNEVIKKEFETLNDLLKSHTDLQGASLGGLFKYLRPLQNLVSSAKEFLGSANPLVKAIERRITRIRLTRIGLAAALILICIIFFPYRGQGIGILFNLPVVPSTTASLRGSNTSISPESTTSATPSITPIAATHSPPATATLTYTPGLITLGNGYVGLGLVSAWDKPNGKFVGNLVLYDVVTILEKTNDRGDDWYRCTWEKDGVIKEGWLLARYILLGPPPTPRP